MNRNILPVITLLAALTLTGASFFAPQGVGDGFPQGGVEDMALEYLLGSQTFSYDGIPDSVNILDVVAMESFPVQYVVTIAFDCSHAGYGDRTGQILAQVITPHEIRVKIVEGWVVSAVIDERWDELTQLEEGRDDSPDQAKDLAVQYIIESYPELGVELPGYWGFEIITPQGLIGSTLLRPAEFVLSELKASPGNVSVGEEVTVTVKVANIGEVEGTHMVVLKVDWEVSEGFNVTLEANTSTVVSFTIVENDLGSHSVEIGSLTDTFNVLEPAEFEVSDLSIDPDEVEEGNEVTISVSVSNIGENEGSHTVELKLDGSVTDEIYLTLEGGADTTVSFSVLMGVGTHMAEIESLSGSFTITAPSEEPSSQQSFPWTPAIAVGAVALVVIGLITRRYMG